MGSSSIRFVCCRKHSKTKSTGCRMVLHARSPLCCWNQCVFLCRLSDGTSVKAASSAKDPNASEEVSGVFDVVDPSESLLHNVGTHFHRSKGLVRICWLPVG